ncbi:MAG: PilZ domain-containing protein [Planctomycetota bacterium]
MPDPSPNDAPLKFPIPAQATDDGRTAPRVSVPPMYTLLRAKRPGDDKYPWAGHLYDVSMTGMRFELDEPLKTGEQIQLRAMLPGSEHVTIRVEGRVARMHEDGPGPARMGLLIERFLGPHDRRKLTGYLQERLGTPDVAPKTSPAVEQTPLRKAA